MLSGLLQSSSTLIAGVAIALLAVAGVGWLTWTYHHVEAAGADREELRHTLDVARSNEIQAQEAEAARARTQAAYDNIDAAHRAAQATLSQAHTQIAVLRQSLEAMSRDRATEVCYPDTPVTWPTNSDDGAAAPARPRQ